MAPSPVTQEQRQQAWCTAFVFNLDLHADLEIIWERDRWRELGASSIADLCDELLRQRQADDFSVPAECSPQDLQALWQNVPRSEVLSWVRSGGLCLLAAIRMTYWLGPWAEEFAL